MSNYNFDEIGNIQAAISTLLQYNQYALFPVSETVFDNPILLEYFLTPLDSPIEIKVEKIVAVAAAKAVFDNPYIPDFNKERSARNTARDVREALRYAKLEYHAQTQNLSHKEYMRRKRSIAIIKRAAKIKMAKSIAKNLTLTAFATLIAGPIGGSITFATRLIWKFIPDKIRKPIEQKLKEIKEKAISTIKTCSNYLMSTKVGKKLKKIVEIIRPKVQAIVDPIKNVVTHSVDYVKSFWPF